MTVIQTGIFTLFERFPGRRDAMRALYDQSQNFKELCEDHQKCREAIRYWSRSENKDAALRLREYESLMRELEDEISDSLDDSRR